MFKDLFGDPLQLKFGLLKFGAFFFGKLKSISKSLLNEVGILENLAKQEN